MSPGPTLSDAQMQVLRQVVAREGERRPSQRATIRNIARETGLSIGWVHHTLADLHNLGFVRRRAWGVRLPYDPTDKGRCAVNGTVNRTPKAS